jgi:hypothetical protein
VDDEAGHVVGGEQEVGAERVTGAADADLAALADTGGELPPLVELAVGRRVGLRYDAEDRAAVDDDGAVVDPVAVAQRWARSGMPVTREGRFMCASREELSGYLGREAGLNVPVHIATENMDLSADLKRALAHARAGNQEKKQKGKR